MSERSRLLGLAFLAGVCGLAYEVLYSRLLTTHLGDMFYVNASILTGFLLMLGVGALAAHRVVVHLPAVQLCLGLYAALAGLGARLGQDVFLRHVTPLAVSPLAAFLVVLALVAVPATLSGFSVPLFARWLGDREGDAEDRSAAFRAVYAWYNLGAALCVLAVEFVLLRLLGLSRTLLAIALVNLVIGLALHRRRQPDPAAAGAAAGRRAERGDSAVLGAGAAVFLLGLASGIVQLLVLRLAITLFGPYHENFTLVIALGLGTITLGTWLTRRADLDLGRLATLGALGVPASFLLWPVAILLWGEVNGAFGDVWLDRALRLGVLFLGGGLALTFFGATVPAALRDRAGDRAAAGRLLALASFGNAAGYLLTLVLARERVPDQALAGVVGAVVVGVGWLTRRGAAGAGWWRARLAVPAGAALLGLALGVWPGRLLELSHVHLSDAHVRDAIGARLRTVAVHRRYGHQVTVLQEPDGAEQLVIDGHLSLVIPPEGRPVPQEFVVGTAPAFFARDRRHALVLGVGTGITAGAATHLFERVTAVEINPAVLEVLPRYASRNNGLAEHPRTTVLLQDGLTLLAPGTGRFDAIINTVTSPRFFSSSKLYTREFFDLAAGNLAPGGVYACWFDNEVGPEGAAIMLATLRESFPHVAFLLLRAGYFLVVAGREPLAFTAAPPVDPDELAAAYRRLDAALPLDQLVRSLVVAGPAVLDRAGTAPVNTLDLPALEFALTKRPLGRSAGVSVRSFLGFDFRDSWPEEPVPSRPPHPLGGARAVALMALNEPAGILLVREALREQRFPDPTWSALVPGLLRHARRMDRPESALGWADLLLEQDRPDAADLTLQAWMDLVPPDSGGRFRRGLEYALWLRARLAQRGGQAFPEALREPYLGALRAARFPYLEAAGHDEVRRAWDALVRAALLRDWAAVPRAAEAVQALSGTLAAADATDLRRLAWLLEAAAARARGQAEVAMDRLERIAGLHPLDPLPRIELLRALPPGSPAHDAHTRFLARLGPSPGVNRPLHRLLALVDPAGGSARPGEAERF